MDAIPFSSHAETMASQFAAWAAITVPNVAIAIMVLVLGWWLAGFVQRRVFRLIEDQPNIDTTLRSFISSLVRYAILAIVLIAVLGQIGVQTTSILAALGAIAIAIGLALQGTLSNIAAGIMLVWLRPFRIGDVIESGSSAGTVTEVGLFACELRTVDGIYLFVPNSEIWNSRIINYARLPTRMIELKYSIAYSDDISKGLETLIELSRSHDKVHTEPQPLAYVDALDDSAVILALRVWVDTPEYWPVRRELTERGKIALESAGLSIPFPQRDVHLYNASMPSEKRAA